MGDLQQPGGAPGLAAGPNRDAWREIRNQINDNEQKLLELHFDYQQKVNVNEALKLELRQTLQDTRDCEERASRCGLDCFAASKQVKELEQQLAALQHDAQLLTRQLLGEEQALAADAAKLQDTRCYFSQHLATQQAHVAKLQQMLAAMQGGGACGAAADVLVVAPAAAAAAAAAAADETAAA